MKTPEEVLLFLDVCKPGRCFEYIPKSPPIRLTERYFLEKIGSCRFVWVDEDNVRLISGTFGFEVSTLEAENWLDAAELVPLQDTNKVPEELLWD